MQAARQDCSKQRKLAQETQDKYQRELMLHTETKEEQEENSGLNQVQY